MPTRTQGYPKTSFCLICLTTRRSNSSPLLHTSPPLTGPFKTHAGKALTKRATFKASGVQKSQRYQASSLQSSRHAASRVRLRTEEGLTCKAHHKNSLQLSPCQEDQASPKDSLSLSLSPSLPSYLTITIRVQS